MGLEGRGAHYSGARRAMEAVLARCYRGAWPAKIARAIGFQRRVLVLQHTVRAARWPRHVRSLRIGFASDFHAGPTTHPAMIDLALDRLAAQRPDVLLLGGDFVLFHARHIEAVAPRFARIPAPFGRFAVLGNHDLWADDRRIVRALERAGITVLVNTGARLNPPFAHVVVSGLDDTWTGHADAAAACAVPATTRVVLMHAPEGLLSLRGRSFDVAFCGHTHGGQIALPAGIPILAPGPLSRSYNHGRFGGCDGVLLVSRGVGTGELPFRLFAPADVMLCQLGDREGEAEAGLRAVCPYL
jgi:predicted MPP superfamily phosphohydrolase